MDNTNEIVEWLRAVQKVARVDVGQIARDAEFGWLWRVEIPLNAQCESPGAVVRLVDGSTICSAEDALEALAMVERAVRDANCSMTGALPAWAVRQVVLDVGHDAEEILAHVVAALPTVAAQVAACAVIAAGSKRAARLATMAALDAAMDAWSEEVCGCSMDSRGPDISDSGECIAVHFIRVYDGLPMVYGWEMDDRRMLSILRREAAEIVVRCALGHAQRALADLSVTRVP